MRRSRWILCTAIYCVSLALLGGCVSPEVKYAIRTGEALQHAYVAEMKLGRTTRESDQAFLEGMADFWTAMRQGLGLRSPPGSVVSR